jgi:hypothetical protein
VVVVVEVWEEVEEKAWEEAREEARGAGGMRECAGCRSVKVPSGTFI